jgi:hypothetical protein
MPQHTVVKVTDLKEYALPEGALCLTRNGWEYGQPYLVNIVFKGTTLEAVMDNVDANYRNLLGPGEIQMITENPTGNLTNDGQAVPGYLVFVPTPGDQLS